MERRSTVAAVLNQKGGVGKTTVTLGLAAAAQRAGDRCLVIDLDPQGSASWSLGVEASDEHLSVGDVLRTGESKVARAAIVTSGWGEGVDVLPASANLIDREADSTDRESTLRLRSAIDPIKDDYRFVFVDCAPSLGPTTRSGLALADRVLMVVELSALSIRGAEAVLSVVEDIWADLNPGLDIGGVIVNRAPAVSIEAMRQEEALNRLMGKRAVWHPFIPQRTILNEAVGDRCPVHDLGYRANDIVATFDSLYRKLIRVSAKS
ncbi:MAG: AAA family ATPase [Microthrixaceae bacterium]